MTLNKSAAVLIVAFACLLVSGSTGEHCRIVQISGLQSIFAVAPSPTGEAVVFYGSPDETEGELLTGNLFRLELGRGNGKAVRVPAPPSSNPDLPVWRPDGSAVYFGTNEGIFRLGSAGEKPKLLWKGQSQGLAISSDGLLLGFWCLEKGTDTLVVYDLAKNSAVRRWRMTDRFEGDKAGWDLAFSQQDAAIYARTFDEASSTPLKRFDLKSGKISIVADDCYAVAPGQQGTYFIAVSASTKSLQKVEFMDSPPQLIMKNFKYDSLSKTGDRNWLVSENYRTNDVALINIENGEVRSVGKHDEATLLSTGKLLLVDKAKIIVGNSGWPR